MNKQELIEHIDKLPYVEGPIADTVTVNRRWILESIEQLDEPQKVTIPQFVADWYEKHKNNIDFEIWHYLHSFSYQEEDEFKKWMNKLGEKQIQTIVNMHQFGYEVEEEKRYLVKIKGNIRDNILAYGLYVGRFFFVPDGENDSQRKTHTRKELEEAGFSEVFNSPLFEVEEVEK
jgi:hypothetical protein|nr:MAG TPA: Protein of unknown function (DUF1642) [Bacteriophage sp.]